MRFIFVIAIAAAVAGCGQPATPPAAPLEVQTIENTSPKLATLDPPPLLGEQPVRPDPPATDTGGKTPTPPGKTPAQPSDIETMKARTNLPFTPPIAMDPVDGSKVSITAETPVFSYKDRWYYFSSQANRNSFRANPEEYVKGSLSTY